MGTCGVCDGSGICQNEYHGKSLIGTAALGLSRVLVDEECPECGGMTTEPLKCGTCGGTGET